MSKPDYNVDNYLVSELFEIIGLNDMSSEDPPTEEDVKEVTDEYIIRFKKENRPDLITFFQAIQTKLLQYLNDLQTSGENDEYTPDNKQTEDWIKYEALPQDNVEQKNKITERVQKIDVYDNNHVPMNREQLGINNNFQVPVSQDTLNPNLENITTRFINLDSQFRQASGGTESMSTDYTMDLSEPLTNVLSLRLYSVQIPYTWYVIDYPYGNTCFWITNKGNTYKIFVEPGNYNPNDFCLALQQAFTNVKYFQPPYTDTDEQSPGITWSQGFVYTGSTVPAPQIATYNSNNGKITLNLDDWNDPANNSVKSITQYTETFDFETDAYYTFFDLTGKKKCYVSTTYSCSNNHNVQTFNGTLGWLMGFRLPLQPVFKGGNKPQGLLNLYGTKYFIIVLDDYNQNRINNGLITIAELSKALALPSYYSTTQPYICLSNVSSSYSGITDINAIGNLSNITPADAVAMGLNPDNLFNSLQDKLEFGSGKIQQILPSAPRTLTQAQIYTINEIIKNRNKTISFRAKAPTNADTFAIIPIKYGSMTTGQLYTELSGQFQDNKRIYFGPVNIDRLRIRLLDDRGNVVDLHGADWSITILSENLYQY